jgi:hypothetical protein
VLMLLGDDGLSYVARLMCGWQCIGRPHRTSTIFLIGCGLVFSFSFSISTYPPHFRVTVLSDMNLHFIKCVGKAII